MDAIHIQGGVALQGKVRIQGSKNAALPVLAATLLTNEPSYIHNCPQIADVHRMISLLKSLGCSVCRENCGLRVDAGNVSAGEMQGEAVKGMRSSLCLLGALIGRCGQVIMEYPGGCIIGERPIDLHLKALGQMGVVFSEEGGRLKANADTLHGADIELNFPSVGATENIILAAVMAEGDTRISGAAMEPEVTALCDYLQKCGAVIEGCGTSQLTIQGGRMLYGADYTIPSDRIVAGTYLFACLATGGCVLLEEAPAREMAATLEVAESMGARCMTAGEGIFVQAPGRPKLIDVLRTAPYPGFPTDLQSIALAAMCRGEGECIIEERIFENRFRILEPLVSMGADISLMDGCSVRLKGVNKLKGITTQAQELRGGAALVLAGLQAEGESIITECSYIYRGYENICKDLRELGARIAGV